MDNTEFNFKKKQSWFEQFLLKIESIDLGKWTVPTAILN